MSSEERIIDSKGINYISSNKNKSLKTKFFVLDVNIENVEHKKLKK
jgi:hypothetical protein